MGETLDIRLEATKEGVASFVEAFDRFGEEHPIPKKDFFDIHVAMDEVLNNIASYGGDGEHWFQVVMHFGDGAIDIVVSDNGRPFNPLAAEDPDVTLGIDERDIGGLGIFLVKRLMDDLQYRRSGNVNELRLTKKLAG